MLDGFFFHLISSYFRFYACSIRCCVLFLFYAPSLFVSLIRSCSFCMRVFICLCVCVCLFGSCCHIWFSLRVILIFFSFILLPSTNKLKHNHLNHLILKIRLTRSHIFGFPVFCCIRSRWFFFFSLLFSPLSVLFFSRAVNYSAK